MTFRYGFPTFPFARIIYELTMACAYGECLSDIKNVSTEFYPCLITLYVESVIFLILALYLYQVNIYTKLH